MATGVAESVKTDKYKRFRGDILTIQAHWGQDASINNNRPMPGTIEHGTDNNTSLSRGNGKVITA